MGIFGSRAKAYEAAGIDRPNIGSQILNQIGINLLGVDLNRQKLEDALAKRQSEFTDALGQRLLPQYDDGGDAPTVGQGGNAATWQYRPPQRTADPLSANSPELGAIALQAQKLGVPMAQVLDVLKAQQPDVTYDGRGYGYDRKTGRDVGYHADLGQGVRPTAGGGAEVVQGFPDAMAKIEGAKTMGQEGAKAAYDLIDVPDGRGGSIKMPRAAYLAAVGQGGAGRGEGLGYAPPAAKLSADKIVADAQANAQVGLPAALQTSQQALDAIASLKADPALKDRVGLVGILPAIPGTPGADFDARVDQLKGKLFLEAYAGLKGGGQITEVEGKKATEAIGRLKTTQSQAGFNKALDDLAEVIKAGQDRVKAQAGGASSTYPGASGPRTTMGRSRIISVQ